MPSWISRRAIRRLVWSGCLTACLAPWCLGETESPAPSEKAPGDPAIRAADVKRHVYFLASDMLEGRHAGQRGGRAAGNYLGQQFAKLKLRGGCDGGKSYYQEFGQECRNILAVIPGGDPVLRDEILLIGAHYDHVGYGSRATSEGPVGYIHNGADDNASGTSALLEIAEAFAHAPAPPRRTLVFAFWDGEEQGLLGSRHWVQHPTLPLGRVKLLMNIDMVGRLTDGRVELFGSRTSPGLRELVSRHNPDAALDVEFTWEMPPNSDHQPFYERRIPIVMPFTGYHADYHRPSDDVDKVNYAGIEQIARWMHAALSELADAPAAPRFRDAALRENNAVRASIEVPAAARQDRLGATWRAERDSSAVVVTAIGAQTPAARAGLRVGDRIVACHGAALSAEPLARLLLSAPETVTLSVRRQGAPDPIDVPVRLAGRPVRVGIAWREDSADPHAAVVTRVDADSWADAAGVKVHDRVRAMNGAPLRDLEEFRNRLATDAFPIELQLERRGRLRTVKLGPVVAE